MIADPWLRQDLTVSAPCRGIGRYVRAPCRRPGGGAPAHEVAAPEPHARMLDADRLLDAVIDPEQGVCWRSNT